MLRLNGFTRLSLQCLDRTRNPLDSEFCKNLIESAKRIKSKPIAKKKPFSSQIIKDILDAYNKEDANLKDVRIAALCLLAFAGFFWYNELCNIAPNHIECYSQYIKIFVPRRKTDVYREGNSIPGGLLPHTSLSCSLPIIWHSGVLHA